MYVPSEQVKEKKEEKQSAFERPKTERIMEPKKLLNIKIKNDAKIPDISFDLSTAADWMKIQTTEEKKLELRFDKDLNLRLEKKFEESYKQNLKFMVTEIPKKESVKSKIKIGFHF